MRASVGFRRSPQARTDGVRFYTEQKAVTSRWPTGTRAGAEFKMATIG
jgi:hypothetical protein